METKQATHDVIAGVLDAFRSHQILIGSDVVFIEPGTTLQRVLRQSLNPSNPTPAE